MSPLFQILGAVIGYLIAQLVRHFHRTNFWKRVEANATHYLEDPNVPIEDAATAAERALLEAQRPQLSSIERAIEKK